MLPLDHGRALERLITVAEERALWKVTIEHPDLAEPFELVSPRTASVEALGHVEHELSRRFNVNLRRIAKVTIEAVREKLL